MKTENKESRLYRQLIRCKSDTRREIIIHTLVSLLIAAGGALCCFFTYKNESLESAVGLFIASLIGIGVYLFFSIKGLKSNIALNKQREIRADALSSSELSSLESQIEREELQFRTFYMLDEYFYAPKEKLLIRYDEITEFKNIIHSTNGMKDGMRIAITDNKGLLYEIIVKQWKEYMKSCSSTAQVVYQKNNTM